MTQNHGRGHFLCCDEIGIAILKRYFSDSAMWQIAKNAKELRLVTKLKFFILYSSIHIYDFHPVVPVYFCNCNVNVYYNSERVLC